MTTPTFCRARSWSRDNCEGTLAWWEGEPWRHAAFCARHMERERRMQDMREHPGGKMLRAKVYDITDMIAERRAYNDAHRDDDDDERGGTP